MGVGGAEEVVYLLMVYCVGFLLGGLVAAVVAEDVQRYRGRTGFSTVKWFAAG